MDFLIAILASAVRSGTPVLYATLGEVISERAGVMNLGLEGVMLVGAYTGFAVTKSTGDPWLGLLAIFRRCGNNTDPCIFVHHPDVQPGSKRPCDGPYRLRPQRTSGQERCPERLSPE